MEDLEKLKKIVSDRNFVESYLHLFETTRYCTMQSNNDQVKSNQELRNRLQEIRKRSSVVSQQGNNNKDQLYIIVTWEMPIHIKRVTEKNQMSHFVAENYTFPKSVHPLISGVYDYLKQKSIHFIWVCAMDLEFNFIDDQERQKIKELMKNKYNVQPVFLQQTTVELGICKFLTRMKFEERNTTDFFDMNELNHQKLASGSSPSFASSYKVTKLDLCWEQYQEINKAFAKELAAISKVPQSSIFALFISGPQFLLLPSYYRDRMQDRKGKSVKQQKHIIVYQQSNPYL